LEAQQVAFVPMKAFALQKVSTQPTRVSSTATDNERHGNYLRDNIGRLLDKLLVDGNPAVPYTLAIVSATVALFSRIRLIIAALGRARL
jgi:hypothetical protein